MQHSRNHDTETLASHRNTFVDHLPADARGTVQLLRMEAARTIIPNKDRRIADNTLTIVEEAEKVFAELVRTRYQLAEARGELEPSEVPFTVSAN